MRIRIFIFFLPVILAPALLFAQPCPSFGADTTLCTGQSLILDGGTASSYLWSTGATTSTLTVSAAGTFWVQADTGTGTCSDTIVVSFAAPPTAGILASGPVNLCNGDSVSFTGSGGSSYQWLHNAAPIPGGNNITWMATTPGDYAVIVNGPGNCPDTSLTYSVTWFPPFQPSLIASDTFLCPGDTLLLTASGGNNPQWYFNSAPVSGATGPQFSATQAGVYSVVLTDGHNCPVTATLEIFNGGNPVVTFVSEADIACENDSTRFIASGAETYEWFEGQGTQPLGTDSLFYALHSGEYYVVGYTACGSDTSPLYTYFAWNAPVADFGYVQLPGYHVEFNDQSVEPTEWLWDFQPGTATVPNPENHFPGEGTFPVMLTVTDFRGCQDSLLQNVILLNEEVFVPNVFTPNGDGILDVWVLETGILDRGILNILDRWGHLVFSTPIQAETTTWSGTDLSGLPVPPGVYYFTAEGVTPGGKTEQRAGNITLLR